MATIMLEEGPPTITTIISREEVGDALPVALTVSP